MEVPFDVSALTRAGASGSGSARNSTKLFGNRPTFPFSDPLHQPSSSSTTSSIISPTDKPSSSTCSGSYSNVTRAFRPETEATRLVL